jgi:hypothetical protein
MSNFWSTLVGGLITWLVAWWYYAKAGKELRKEAAALRNLLTTILGSLEHAGLAKLTRDANGNITGFIVDLAGTITVPSPILKGTGLVSQGPGPAPPA